ncbi:hypothetical protein [Bdellovibrio bacteriovorus]|uniref:Uncharacterized protein n=1 Tax=Bdellovibrio bacteriovorus TaxID=959 RepID=A0A150WDV8_BDEBC|nr:hypothetical protein [Bdellovibrio bacteriovorus]KYG61097.1 hypothetical protein AZI85_09065 [Bdellovibrio bacteriovorus]
MKMMTIVFSLLLSSTAFATWAEDFELLKDVPRSYEDSGSICEEVARIEVQREYQKPQYDVIVGIAYGNESRVIGELDIVVFDNNLNKVIKIGEVKCWKDMRGGLEKAKEQRARFLKTVRSTANNLRFFSTSTKEAYSPEQFKFVNEFFSMGQKGTVSAGYDKELEYTLKEMHNYRYEMIRCQNRKECARP